jgi:DNA repair protein RecN (Recombination protein N)
VLAELHIRDFALIERQRVAVGAGLCVITGGTGAGKSLVVDALDFVLGARASADIVRAGAEEALVEALFYVDGPEERARIAAASPLLTEAGSAFEGELVLARSMSKAGRSRAMVNGRLAPVGALAELATRLVEVCGQHETHALFDAAEQREVVDLFGGHGALGERYRGAFEALRAAEKRLAALLEGARDRARREEAVAFEAKELRALAVSRGELAELERELLALESAAKIRAALRAGYAGIYESEGSVLAKLRAIEREVAPLGRAVPELLEVAARIEEASRILADAALACRDLRSRHRMDEGRRQEVDERIGAIRRLALKLGIDADEMPARLAALETERVALEGAEEGAASLRAEVARLEEELREAGAALSSARRAAAARLAREVEAELQDLGMKGAALSIDVAPDPEGPIASGLDRVELRIRTNAGDEPRPLRRIASGGEASRVMLAIKARLAGKGSVPTLVFDEVDANVGGRLGEAIGRRLRALARRYQVLCVTHLPQIAAFGERHLHVSKATHAGATVTSIAELQGEARVREIAQMIRGDSVTEVTLAEAREMIHAATAEPEPAAAPDRRAPAPGPAPSRREKSRKVAP